MTNLVKVDKLVKKYSKRVDERPALNGISFEIERGMIIGLLGPNGSGKTTLIKLMNGLLTKTSGEVLINGMSPCPKTKNVVAYLPERMCLPNGNTINDMVDYFNDFYENFDKSRALEMLSSLGIDPRKRIKTLSKGTKEKVQLILVMSRNADLYILDEPIAGVDPATRDYILKTIISNYQPTASILISTHLISDVENILDSVIIIKNGELIRQSSVEEIRESEGKSLDSYFREVFAC